jgi:hypothetical protein
MKALLTLATLLALAAPAPAAAAPAPAAVDAAARELPRERWQRAVTHAKRLHQAVADAVANQDYADDLPATGFSGSPARRAKKGASLRRAPAPFTAEPDLRDAPNSAAPNSAAPVTLPAAEPLPGLDASLVKAVKPGLPPQSPAGPIPAAQRGVPPLPTMDQAMAPLIQAQMGGLADASPAITPSQSAASACPAPRPGAALKGAPAPRPGERVARASCPAPRGI